MSKTVTAVMKEMTEKNYDSKLDLNWTFSPHGKEGHHCDFAAYCGKDERDMLHKESGTICFTKRL